jgi:hypothetical protein
MARMSDRRVTVVRLDDLPPDPDAHPGDPGVEWHPRPDKTEARDAEGNLRDLSDAEVSDHIVKPEAEEQVDSVLHRRMLGHAPLAAEDSDQSPDGEV